MQILVVGGGGREHALAWRLAQSNMVSKVFVAPGNSGTQMEPKLENVAIINLDELCNFAISRRIDFTVVGPEAPLALGIVDKFRGHGLKIWGPTQYCAQLESSKDFAKQFMQRYNIPTAKYQTFDNSITAKNYVAQHGLPIVIKADGLAAGKGVLVATTQDEAFQFIDAIFTEQKFGDAGSKVVIEEFLDGVEASFIVMIDGDNVLAMASSQDHKRLLDNDRGSNTGGMGAYSPAPIVDNCVHEYVLQKIIQPVIDGMKADGHEYTGFLYAGLMISADGIINTLEFNCRFGDPETQPIMMRLESDFADLIKAGIEKRLDKVVAKWSDDFAVGVVLATAGYPEKPQIGNVITGLDSLNEQVKVFHSGTRICNDELLTSGGRALCVVARGHSIKDAQKNVYQAVNKIKFTGMQYRTDIGNKTGF